MNHLIVKQEPWNLSAATILAAACDETFTISDLQADCESGRASLFNIFSNDEAHIASMALRVDGEGDHKEMVVVAGGGYLKGASLYKVLTPYVEALAVQNGCRFLRGHTSRRGIGRLMENAGWEQSEIIFRKRVSDGRKI
ncbi:MAG: hypothetical protein DI626_06260 [Micavibrio aeruginosavorus]|uniref:Uncharacterized protein n=1 Tax=Micavibrio aeruginosavorus TaxID=349221 RepID=A0A2W5BTP4_9BACT|nr:MAG: hypothetical protein DI626_06260 [Micavibrio aeruginosavorus]